MGDSSDALVQQKKGADEVVKWAEYEALRDSLTQKLDTVNGELTTKLEDFSGHLTEELQHVDNSIGGLVTSSEAQQTQLNTLQMAVTTVTQQLADLTTLVNQRLPNPGDDDSVHNAGHEAHEDANYPIGPGRGFAPIHGRGGHMHQARRVPLANAPENHREDDGLGRIKFSIPQFSFDTNDVEEYLRWELKIEKLWRLHNYTEDKKIKLASSEFEGYALQWWDNIVRQRALDGVPEIITWRTMKQVMRDRFVPPNYVRSLYDKLQNLRQGTMTVDEYFKEMELILQRARVREEPEQTMQRFLSGLQYKIRSVVRHYNYHDMNELLHHAREAESQLLEESKFAARNTSRNRFSAPSTSTPSAQNSAMRGTSSSKAETSVSNTKRTPQPAASSHNSTSSTARNRDMNCHTSGGKGHFKRDCPNKKVMLINEDNEYETGDDADPNDDDDACDDDDGPLDAYATHYPTIVCTQTLSVTPSLMANFF